MLKGNKVFYTLALVVSAFLLWLWYWLGFDHVDGPFDLVLSVIWWVGVAVACYAISRIEDKRRARVRTCYVSGKDVYNSEAGIVAAPAVEELADGLRDIIQNLRYGFEVKELPEDARYDLVVHSSKFELHRETDERGDWVERLDWRGDVLFTANPDDDPVPFSSKDELQHILATAM